ncbi:MAG: hypothetical protein M1814_005157 [Vezdaea aestivalis]|nr:MAG: hypothetical protein M1814_005157 [Vezdaea aestivalis]
MNESGRHGSSRDYHSSRGEHREDRREHRDRDRDHGRRRSRSPGHRSSRSSRRDYEQDSYSSSRDYRAKEREDRYAGGSRRDEREWDRDRGPRRERREDDRGGRRDRDLFEDRMRPPRRDRDAAPGGGRDRKKSASPPPKKKEPTPDLTDIVSVLDRKRRLTQWDIKPPGYENVTAEQAKLSGMFPLPGAPRQPSQDPSRLQALINQSGGSASASALKPSSARQSKRLFIHHMPPSTTDDSITQFFNLQLNGLNIVQGIDPCISAQISTDRSFALLEFKTPEDATYALALDGIKMEDSDQMEASNGTGQGLSISRPKDYIVPTPTEESTEAEGVVSSTVPDSPNKICISSIPPGFDDDLVTQLLVEFGALKAFVLVKDRGTSESRGIAFCEYVASASTDIIVEALNGMQLENNHLKAQRANLGVQQASGLEMSVGAMSMLAGTTSNDHDASRVIQLLNMVTAEELMDQREYAEILEDVKEKCEEFGEVTEIKIPRPTGGSRQSSGVGKIYVKFATVEAAGKALRDLAGQKFADRTVISTYFSEASFFVLKFSICQYMN